MEQNLIFLPFLGMMLVTFVVLGIMARRRGADASSSGLSVAQLPPTRYEQANRQTGTLWSPRAEAASDHFLNLFETPVLFYALCLALFMTQSVSVLVIWMAWGYLASRIAHAFIHLTYNHVMHRFVAFFASLLCLVIMGLKLVLSIL